MHAPPSCRRSPSTARRPRHADVKSALNDKDWAFACTRQPSGQDSIRPAIYARRCGRCRASPGSPYDNTDLIRPALLAACVHRNRQGHDRIRAGRARCAADHVELHRRSRAKDSSTGCRFTAWCPISSCRMAIRAAMGKAAPAITIRDELNERPFLRGTVGMALSWKDTGGSQFFITHSPQPHLDAQLHGIRSGRERHGRGRSNSAGRHDSADTRVGREDDAVVASRLRRFGETLAESSAKAGVKTKGGDGRPLFKRERQLNASCRPSSSRP